MVQFICNLIDKMIERWSFNTGELQGRIQGGGGAPDVHPPKIGKNMIFWRKIVIFHTKSPKNVRASLRSAQFS